MKRRQENPSTVSFATALGENVYGLLFGEYDVQAERWRSHEASDAGSVAVYGVYGDR